MNFTFLGTGTSQGVPLIGCACNVCKSTDLRDKRLRSSLLVEVNGKIFVIDTGPDFRQQMLRENVKRLDAVIFTHEHRDHMAGFDDIRAYNFIMKKKIDVFANKDVHRAIEREFPYIFDGSDYPGIPQVNMHRISNEKFTVEGVEITPVEVLHLKLPVFGFRIGDFTYITDANFIAEKEKEKIKGSRVLVLNALRKEPHVSHFNLEQAIELARGLKAEQTYFTHISHQLGLHDEVQKELSDGMFLAYDTLSLTL